MPSSSLYFAANVKLPTISYDNCLARNPVLPDNVYKILMQFLCNDDVLSNMLYTPTLIVF
ncbi:hypothetical protein KDA_65810 [Dictyobacter alpinus]|uniref:Uncharacterized protein n=1 Tax=Dictyobacter alpinus TaxID=2014873 RepID=A0A402BIL6_9CHLR|nr:hypothetical protein KDA_65810 [Dictyobacter alpinus]